ncbi:MAG TPA: lipoate--protein ligase [Clostridia bacterium]|nr:lipoate--protein ligase [Clostridia bacterium]
MKTKVFISSVNDPRVNLALEEMLTQDCKEDEYIFYLWQNENTIVIGRNQNPHRECDLQKVEEDGVILVRRPSGGGAVFHDLGNLNFTFIAHEKKYSQQMNFEIVLDALKVFGLEGEFSGRNDLLIEDRKFSGNAYSHYKNTRVHHGTLMLEVDLTKMSRYLNVHPLKMKAKGVTSVRSRVINLYELAPQMKVEDLKEALIGSFEARLGRAEKIEQLDKASLRGYKHADKYFSWEWNIGETPNFSLELENKFDWGLISFFLDLNKGRIKRAKIFTDALVNEDFAGLGAALEGSEFNKKSMEKVLFSQLSDKKISKELIEWLSSQGI